LKVAFELGAFSKDGVVSETGINNWIEVDKAFGSIKPDQQIESMAAAAQPVE
jgi:hypothetical protein